MKIMGINMPDLTWLGCRKIYNFWFVLDEISYIGYHSSLSPVSLFLGLEIFVCMVYRLKLWCSRLKMFPMILSCVALACVPISVDCSLNYYVPCLLAKNAYSWRFVVFFKKGTYYSFEFLDRSPKLSTKYNSKGDIFYKPMVVGYRGECAGSNNQHL